MLNILPAPTQTHYIQSAPTLQPVFERAVASIREPPPYKQRQGWTPRSLADFGDGGAFPEIPVAQYPLGMGKKKDKKEGNATSLQVDAEGNVRYDAVIKQNVRPGQTVFSQHTDLVEKRPESEDSLMRPSEKKQQELTEKTREALEKLVDAKITAARLRRMATKTDPSAGQPVYIRYTPGQQGQGAKSRIVRLHEMPVDPLEPPKYRHKKVPTGPPSPPVPVLHSPPRKVTHQDQLNWKIPPCISNWKNIKGYTIPLDKRLAADGRNQQEKSTNPRFKSVADALHEVEGTVRAEIAVRRATRQSLREDEMREKSKSILETAKEFRRKRTAGSAGTATGAAAGRAAETYAETESKQDAEGRMAREELRHQLHQDRIRTARKEARDKKSRKGPSDRDRDISEKIALDGSSAVTKRRGEAMFDQRLFNQSQGMDSGFGGDDDYNVYNKRLFKSSSSSIYRPSTNADADAYGGEVEKLLEKSTDRFKADREFEGTTDSRRSMKGGARKAPVEFRKEEDEDLFGIKSIVESEKGGRRSTALDVIGKSRGAMHASAGGIYRYRYNVGPSRCNCS